MPLPVFDTFEIRISTEALEDLRVLRKADQKRAVEGIETHLAYEPSGGSRNRKHLRPNQLAEWKLRLGDLRIFGDVDHEASIVKVVACGCKLRDRLRIRGKEWKW